MRKDGANLSVLAHLDGDETLQGHLHDQLIIYDGFSTVAAAHLIAIVLTLYEKQLSNIIGRIDGRRMQNIYLSI